MVMGNIWALIIGWILDRILGDPRWLPHPVVGFGKAISLCEKHFNRGKSRRIKGVVCAGSLIIIVFCFVWGLLLLLKPWSIVRIAVEIIGVFYCLAGTTLAREVKQVFEACGKGLDDARHQIARIVGRDTQSLDEQEIKTAALETLAENLSDGVIAPIFWYLLLGLPGMMSYKMVNTLDSMIGYKNERYREFGCFAAKLDDAANYIPARLTAFLMVLVSIRFKVFSFIERYGRSHASPNSGYPEAALAGILDCRFGGPHDYFGKPVYKPYIGDNPRDLTYKDLDISLSVCFRTELLMLMITVLLRSLW